LVWAVRLLALFNPLLAYFLAKRLSSPLAGLLAAALLTLFGYNVMATNAFNIDGVLLTFYLLALLSLLAALKRGYSPTLALLSGSLLGASILTKETAFANLPLALLAVLLVDWELGAAIWHYAGVALVCLPWWAWRWSETEEVYLIDRLPPSLQLPVVLVSAVVLGLAVAAYALGMVDRLLAVERWRRWVGWFVVVVWSVSLTILVLATGSHKLAKASLGSLGHYFAGLLAPSTIVVPVLLLVGGYMVWKALKGEEGWKLLALALLFQLPVCLLVAVQEWAPRQFLVAQTLTLCALGALVVDAGEVALRGRGYTLLLRLSGAVVALLLVIVLELCSPKTQLRDYPDNTRWLPRQPRWLIG
jgi:4-amino-4-deoxy-L-arabinose transferase-like glycosyltransferase